MKAVSHFFIAVLWLTLFSMVPFLSSTPDNEGPPFHRRKFTLIFGSLSLIFGVGAWVSGPRPPEVFMSFGGHTGFAGIFLVTLAFFSIWRNKPGLLAYAVFTVFSFLAALTTSRAAILLWGIYLCLLAVRAAVKDRLAPLSLVKEVVVPLILGFLVFTLPLFYTSEFFPYLVTDRTRFANPEYYRLEYACRYSRLLRLIPSAFENYIPGILAKMPPEKASEIAIGVAHSRDSRITISRRTFDMIRAEKGGYWPDMRFEQFAGLRWGQASIRYPHNMVLEFGYYYGMGFFFLSFFALVFLAGRLVSDIVLSGSWLIIATAMQSFSFLVLYNLFGGFYDTLVFATTVVLWALARISVSSFDPETV